MNKKTVLIVHGFGPKQDDLELINTIEGLNFNVIYLDWFNWDDISSTKFKEEFKTTLSQNDVSLVIGISLGGIIVGENINLINNIPIVLIASAPKFQPIWYISWLFMLPEVANKLGLKLLKFIIPKILRFNINERVKNNLELFVNLSTFKLMAMLEYLKRTDNRPLLNTIQPDFTVINGEKDFLMPANVWKMYGFNKRITKKAFHHMVMNGEQLEFIAEKLNRAG